MFHRMIAFYAALIAALTAVPTVVSAESARQVYGNGVHAYFAGRLTDADQLLSAVIDQGSQDPRCYYFRGVTYAKQGRQLEAEQDFRTAATLEANSKSPLNIGMSLERVQGAHRLKLEAIRRETKLAIAQQRAGKQPNNLTTSNGIGGGNNYTQENNRGYDPTDPFAGVGENNTGGKASDVTATNEPPITGNVQGAASGALRGLMGAVSKAIPSGFNIGANLPGLPGGIGGDGSFPPAGTEVENPFGGDFGADDPAMEEDADDPFGGGDSGADEPAMEEDTDDLFGGDDIGTDGPAMEEDGDDPFGTDGPAMEEDGEDPFGTDGPAMEEDGEDPFGTDEPAMEEDSDDPFGGEAGDDEDVDPFADDE